MTNIETTPNPLPNGLVNALRDKKVIPFVGAGVPMDVRTADLGDSAFPSWDSLIKELRGALVGEGHGAIASRLDGESSVAGNFSPETEEEKFVVKKAFNQVLLKHVDIDYEQIDASTTALARLAWRLSDGKIITSNYDKLLAWTHASPQRVRRIAPGTQEMQTFLNEGRPVVWHLHGHVEDLNRIVFFKDEYSRLYSSGSADSSDEEEERDRRTFEFAFRRVLSECNLLFIGCSLDDPFLLGFIKRAEHDRINVKQHYALVRESEYRQVKDRLKQRNIGSITLIKFPDYGAPLYQVLEALCAASFAHGNDSRELMREFSSLCLPTFLTEDGLCYLAVHDAETFDMQGAPACVVKEANLEKYGIVGQTPQTWRSRMESLIQVGTLWHIRELNRTLRPLGNGPLIRLVWDVERGAVFLYWVPERRADAPGYWLVGATLNQEAVEKSDFTMVEVEHCACDFLESPRVDFRWDGNLPSSPSPVAEPPP